MTDAARGRLARLVDRSVEAVAALLLTALLLAVMAGVVSRAFGAALAWTEEMAQHLLVWCGFVGWMLAARRGAHIRVTVLVDRLAPGARRWAEVAIQLTVIVFALGLLRYGPRLIGRNLDIEWVSLPLSAALLYVPIPLAAAVLVAQAGVEIARALGRSAPPSPTAVAPL